MQLMTLVVTAALSLAPQAAVREELERLAPRIPCLPEGFVHYDRSPCFEGFCSLWMEPAELEALTLYAERRTSYPRAELVALLQHKEPKVRVLAMCGLYARLEPRETLPLLRDLVEDEGIGFARGITIHLPGPDVHGKPHYSKAELRRLSLGKPITVGEMARELVETYMTQAYHRYTIDGYRSYPGWDTYWSERADREHCLSWFQVALNHATGGTTPFQEERRARVAALRARVDSIASPEREWVLIWLAQPEQHPLVSASERVALAKSLGSEALMRFLRGEAPTDDPDMRTRDNNDWQRSRLMAFLLEHAAEVLEPRYADELLALDRKHFDLASTDDFSFNDSQWAVAAAKLQPSRAQEILIEALGRYSATHAPGDRARIMRALWEATRGKNLARILDWFFAEEPSPGSYGFGRQGFAQEIREGDSELLRALLRDPRLDTLDVLTLQVLAHKTNEVAGREIFSESRLRAMWHPYGLSHYHGSSEKARGEHPEPTAALEAEMTKIRAALRRYAES